MLHIPMRYVALLLACMVQAVALAQVSVSVPVELSGPAGTRQVTGLATPGAGDAALSVEGAILGKAHWATATFSNGRFVVSAPFSNTGVQQGMLLRFSSPATAQGALQVVFAGDTLPLRRPDGSTPVRGQLRPGAVVEIVRGAQAWVLMGPAVEGCPHTSLPINDRICVETTTSTAPTPYMNAVEFCEVRGGRLCTWDEWYTACTQLGSQLNGLFTNWEWLDDTGNHDHHGIQVGLGDCFNHRSLAISSSGGPSVGRCCYQLR